MGVNMASPCPLPFLKCKGKVDYTAKDVHKYYPRRLTQIIDLTDKTGIEHAFIVYDSYFVGRYAGPIIIGKKTRHGQQVLIDPDNRKGKMIAVIHTHPPEDPFGVGDYEEFSEIDLKHGAEQGLIYDGVIGKDVEDYWVLTVRNYKTGEVTQTTVKKGIEQFIGGYEWYKMHKIQVN